MENGHGCYLIFEYNNDVYIINRCSQTVGDIISDINYEPEKYYNGTFHRGFLKECK